ncbi:Probable E3 ubiquitin-protein ligase RHA2B [Striga hermonthica]|uniref:Probable E3 ubiquitin-protein ligase RHA2B n=1 Tax=Striga hermonthica TaxID=68872 RepID=A0A9N7NE88_STRHE|nr:Probable E3 ubiquitin-protein ligase RHA2B [Striga hermonthica]
MVILSQMIKRAFDLLLFPQSDSYSSHIIDSHTLTRVTGYGQDLDQCSVCLCSISPGEVIRELKNCGHVFHAACLERWLGHGHWTCPLCRNHVTRRLVFPHQDSGHQPREVLVFNFGHVDSVGNKSSWWLRSTRPERQPNRTGLTSGSKETRGSLRSKDLLVEESIEGQKVKGHKERTSSRMIDEQDNSVLGHLEVMAEMMAFFGNKSSWWLR